MTHWKLIPAALLVLGTVPLGGFATSGRHNQAVEAGTAPALSAETAGKIQIVLRGVLGLYNPEAPSGSVVHVLIPTRRGERLADSNQSVRIPSHHPFVRFRLDQGYTSSGMAGRIQPTSDARFAAVLLQDGERLSIGGGMVGEALRYDRYDLVAPDDTDPYSAFYWVTKLGQICPRRDYRRPYAPGVSTLLAIGNGTLSAEPSTSLWSFGRGEDGRRNYEIASAPGVAWRLTPADDTFTVKFSRGGSLRFSVESAPVEIGNYPLEDIFMSAHHHPQLGEIDYHFELFEEFYDQPHGERQFHLPRLVRDVSPSQLGIRPASAQTTSGPSCGPGHLP